MVDESSMIHPRAFSSHPARCPASKEQFEKDVWEAWGDRPVWARGAAAPGARLFWQELRRGYRFRSSVVRTAVENANKRQLCTRFYMTEDNMADAIGKLVSTRKQARTNAYLMNTANTVPPPAD